jgi:hypothetical protein
VAETGVEYHSPGQALDEAEVKVREGDHQYLLSDLFKA